MCRRFLASCIGTRPVRSQATLDHRPLMPLTVADFVLPCAITYVTWRISVVYSAVSTYGRADIYAAFPPLSLPGVLFGMGITWAWNHRLDGYGDKECLRITPLLWGDTVLYIRSLDTLRQVAGGGSNKIWIKPTWASGGLLVYGPNLATVNLDDWKRHRRIMQPSFSRSTYELVWAETTRVYEDMVKAEKWDTNSGGIVVLKSVNRLAFRFGLAVLGSCGFGLASKFTWTDPPTTQNGHGDVQSSIIAVEDAHLILEFAPKWLWKLPVKSLRNTWREYKSLGKFIDEEAADRKAVIDEALRNGGDNALESVNHDVFSRLVLANQADGKQSLSNSELAGNTFLLLFAGHDTTASTLAASIALLAYYQEEQEKAHQEIVKAIEGNPHFDFSLFSQLPGIVAIFLEAVRLYPAGVLGIRVNLEDTILTVPSSDGKAPPTEIAMPANSKIVIDFIGMQYHSRYFAEPMAFKPSRWIGVGDDSATAFSIGSRACIGKKFAQTEATCFLTNLLRDYKIEPLLKEGETREGWKARILGSIKIVLTLSVTDVPVLLIRR